MTLSRLATRYDEFRTVVTHLSLVGVARFVGLEFERLDARGAVDWIRNRRADAPFAYVVTPNVDHIVRLRTENAIAEVEEAYCRAEVTLCDSEVLARLAKWRGVELTVAAGSDVTEILLQQEMGSNAPIVLIGGDETTAAALARMYSLGNLIQHIPPMGLMGNPAAIDAAADFIVAHPARYVLIAVGSPQQEVIALRALQSGQARGLGLCIGASIDYLTGRSHRAPAFFRRFALEWLYRLLREPRRLWRRYLIRSPRIFLLLGHNDTKR